MHPVKQRAPELGETEAAAFEELFRAHYAFVWRSARRLGAPVDALDDIVQEVFLGAYRSRGRFEARASIKTWLFGITHNVVRQRNRGEHRRKLRAQHAGGRLIAAPASDHAARHAAVHQLDGLLAVLPPEQRVPFLLVELEDVDPSEVASALGLSVNTVYSRLRLARRRLQAEVSRLRAKEEGRRDD